MKTRSLLSLAFLAALLWGGCSSTKTLQSEVPTRALTIDGRVDDWGGALAPMEGERFSLGVRNDGEFLYVALLSRDEGVTRQIVRDGLILWFDPDGGKEKTFGLRFPLGLTALQPPGERGDGPRGGRQQEGEAMRERFEASLVDLDVLGTDGKSRRVAVGSLPGVLVQARLDHGTLVYELKLPLQRSEAFDEAVGATPGAVVGLGLETPEGDREGLRGPGAGRGGRGGMGGVGEMGGGRRGGMRGGQRPSGGRGALAPAEPLELWVRVELVG